MTLPADPPATVPAGTPGRSLWQDAWRRLRRNRAAVASAAVLLLLGLVAALGPLVWPHPHDRIYPSYVRVPAGLEAYPRAEDILPGFEAALRRTRVPFDTPELDGTRVRVELRDDRPIDPRILRYVERSGLFTATRLDLAPDGRSGTLSAGVQRAHFYFGTDALGRDLAARVMIGLRVSLLIGLLASAVALLLGVTYGAISGYAGGRVDEVMMRIVDILYSLPFIFFVILLVVFFGRSIGIIFLAIGANQWLDMARIVRGQTLSLKRQEFVQAAEALGATRAGILRRHVIPNTLGPVIVYVTLLVPQAILMESLLSFLGLGVQEPLTSLGLLISEGAANMQGASWLLVWPALTLTTILFALNFLGDGLRDSLDPKDR